jgi:hypothetical protein
MYLYIYIYILRKGQAVQFNWLYDKGAFILHPDETFSVDFSKVKVFHISSLMVLFFFPLLGHKVCSTFERLKVRLKV